MFTAGITLGPEEGWTSPITLTLIIVGVVLIVVFAYWETKSAHPLMPPFIWKDRNFALLSKCFPELKSTEPRPMIKDEPTYHRL